MQQYGNDQILTSPSDVLTFLGYNHAIFLDVKALSQDMDKAAAKSLEHEAAYLQHLKEEGQAVVEIPKDRNLQDLAQLTMEAKPQWWSSFERQNKFEDELIDDTECLGGLQQIGSPEPEKRSLIYSYRFPSQEYKLKVGAQAVDIAVMENAGTIVDIDEDACIVKIKCGASKEPLPKILPIGPLGSIDSKIIRSAIYSYADHVLEAPKAPMLRPNF